MISLKQKSKGFTIVELLIVIVVIAILATLVIVTFTGIQQRARDSKRQTDVNAIDSHLEAFYADNGYYPSLADLQDTASGGFVQTQLKGLPVDALTDPKGGAITGSAPAPGTYAYSYVATGCTTTSKTDSSNQCTGFTLTAELEGNTTPFSKSSNT